MRVRIENLSKSYPTPADPLVILDGLDLHIDSGDSVAIRGPSGCGKSTLLHILGTLENPDSGSIILDDTDPFTLGEADLARFRNRKIGFVFQDHYLLPQCPVLENVLLPLLITREPPDEGEERARDLLGKAGIGDRADHRPSELSGGERQRTAIARALINNPGLLLCDEPTGNLDAETAERIAGLFVELQDSLSSTIVVVTHSQELAVHFGRQLILSGKKLAEAGA